MPSFVLWFAALGLAALIGDNVMTYMRATGTVGERLAACGRGSLTVFVNVWGGVISIGVMGLDGLAGVTADPQFVTIANAFDAVIPAQYHPLFPAATAALAIWARQRTLGKT